MTAARGSPSLGADVAPKPWKPRLESKYLDSGESKSNCIGLLVDHWVQLQSCQLDICSYMWLMYHHTFIWVAHIKLLLNSLIRSIQASLANSLDLSFCLLTNQDTNPVYLDLQINISKPMEVVTYTHVILCFGAHTDFVRPTNRAQPTRPTKMWLQLALCVIKCFLCGTFNCNMW